MKRIIILFTVALATVVAKAQNKKILFVMSAAHELPLQKGKIYANTGVFLSELYLAYKDIRTLGYQVDFATPSAVVSSIDHESYQSDYWKGKEDLIPEASEFVKTDIGFNHPSTLEQALQRIDQYDGIVVPGGQGLMVDLVKDTTMKQLLQVFAKQHKCIGLICHAPALLTAFSKDNNPFEGYTVNCVSGMEEFFIEHFVMNGKPYNRKIAKQLKGKGFKYKKAGPAKNYAVRDRYLVTSQNPFSHEAFGRLFKEALMDYEANKGR